MAIGLGENGAKAMTTFQFRQQVREHYPHLRVKVRTVSFMDLARGRARCLTIVGRMQSPHEHAEINTWAKLAGILPDTSVRVYVPQEVGR